MSLRASLLAALLGLLETPAASRKPEEQARAGEAKTLSQVSRERIRVTLGELESGSRGRLRITKPKVRAVVPATRARVVELRFTYLGATHEVAPLRSGELRRQVGLKLRAQDGCNVVYVMWRIAPKAGVVVSVKHNPGQHRHAECGNGGYQTVRPRRAVPVPTLKPGSHHSLRAELRGEELEVRVDGKPIWQGALPPEALTFDGPVGLRTDNGRFELELLTQ